MFEIGMRVVCVDAKPRKGGAPPTGLTERKVYTVRGVCSATKGIYLEEIINENHPTWGVEWAYFPDRFAPIRTTNIDIFLKMLKPVEEKV